MANKNIHSANPSCHKCGQPDLGCGAEPHERLVRDNADGKVYCAWCADHLSLLHWGEPAQIRHQDGSEFSFKVEA